MYSYSGWNAATYIVGELREPARNLPRALFAGTAIVIVLYVCLNAVFLLTTPMEELAGQLDVAIVAGKHVFGDIGGRIVGALICSRPGVFDQRHDLDRPARDHDDGRGHAAAAAVLAQIEARRAGRRHRLSARWSRTCCC